jgi:hypothetical protein
LKDDEVGFFAAVVLGEGVDYREEEDGGEEVGAEEEAGRTLIAWSV